LEILVHRHRIVETINCFILNLHVHFDLINLIDIDLINDSLKEYWINIKNRIEKQNITDAKKNYTSAYIFF